MSEMRILTLQLVGLLCACTGDKSGDDTSAALQPLLQLSFEAIPGNGFDVGGAVYDTSAASYADKEAFTSDVLAQVVPGIVGAVGLETSALDEQLTPGGFELATSPSLQIRGDLDQDTARALSAALGYTTWQESVLVADFKATDGDCGYGTVSLPDGALTVALAQSFFEHAASVDPGLAGGYTSFGDDLIFLNLRGDDGQPYSGLEDDAFVADLQNAAESFSASTATLTASGQVDAFLVGDDWTGGAPNGEDYAAELDPDVVTALDRLRETYLEILVAASESYGWSG